MLGVVNMRAGHPKDPWTQEIRVRSGGNNILCTIVTVTSYLMKNSRSRPTRYAYTEWLRADKIHLW